MTFAAILKANPTVSALGLDDPVRAGFQISRQRLRESKGEYQTAVDWLEKHHPSSRTSRGIAYEIERSGGPFLCHGAVILAYRSLGLPFRGTSGHSLILPA